MLLGIEHHWDLLMITDLESIIHALQYSSQYQYKAEVSYLQKVL